MYEVFYVQNILEKHLQSVILGDAYDSSRIIDIASDADVVVHEAPLENELMVKCIDHGHSTPGSYLWWKLYSHCMSTSPWKGSPEIRIAYAGSKKICLAPNPHLSTRVEWREKEECKK